MSKKKQFNEKDIPDDVVNVRAYKKYIEICNLEIFEEHNKYYISKTDAELIIDLATPWPVIKRKIEHLPAWEKEALTAKQKEMRSAMSRRTKQRDKAYGQRSGHIRSEAILSPRTSEIIELFGKYHTVQEVHRIAVTKWNYKVDISSVQAFRVKYLDKIKERQEKFRNDFSDVRLAHKKPRLLELSQLYTDRKIIYERTKSKEDYKLLLATLRQLNQEVEGDKITIEGNIQVDIQHTVNLQMQREIMQRTNILDLVISRIAARNDINPIYMLTKLHKSLYAKYAGFGETFEKADEQKEIDYPSMLVYDFDKIQMASGNYQKEEKQMQVFLPVDEAKQKAGNTFKEKLAKRLRLKQEKLNKGIDELNNLNKD